MAKKINIAESDGKSYTNVKKARRVCRSLLADQIVQSRREKDEALFGVRIEDMNRRRV
jgi:hypothetical protein